MLYDDVSELDSKFRLRRYKSLFGRIHEKAGSLSATESYSADVIYLLDSPTIKQFADSLGISQPNATYKVSSLIEKGYIKKVPSPEDRREFRLQMSDKFYSYYDTQNSYIRDAVTALEEKFSPAELATFRAVLRTLIDEIEQ